MFYDIMRSFGFHEQIFVLVSGNNLVVYIFGLLCLVNLTVFSTLLKFGFFLNHLFLDLFIIHNLRLLLLIEKNCESKHVLNGLVIFNSSKFIAKTL